MQPSPQADEPLGRLIAVARRSIKQLVWSRVSEHGLTPQQFWTMLALRRLGECSLHQVAEGVAFDDPTASRVVAVLVRRGLISSSSHPGDRRRSRLQLSPSGKALLQDLKPVEREIRERVESALSPSERTTLAVLLRKVTTAAEQAAFEAPVQGAARRRAARS